MGERIYFGIIAFWFLGLIAKAFNARREVWAQFWWHVPIHAVALLAIMWSLIIPVGWIIQGFVVAKGHGNNELS